MQGKGRIGMNKVIYASRGENTKKLAAAIAKGAGCEAFSVDSAANMEGVDTLFVGGSIYAGKIDGSLRKFLEGLSASQVRNVVVFGTAAGNKSALPEIKTILEPRGIKVSDEAFQCKGSFLFVNRGRPNDEDLKHAEEFAGKISEGLHAL